MNKPLDMPDGPGWWGYYGEAKGVAWFTKFEIKGDTVTIGWGEDDYAITYDLNWFKRHYRNLKWYRLTMPWDAPQPAADVPLPDFQQTIEAERNIGFIEGVLEGVKARIQKDQPVLRSQEYTIRRCNEVQAWLQRQREAGE